MTDYYFVGTSLPELKIGEKPEISFEAFDELLLLNLSPSDYEKMRALRLFFDLDNLSLFLQGKPLTRYGSLEGVEFEEALLDGGHFPEWVDRFLDEFREKNERIRAFPKLWAYFAQETFPSGQGFLKTYFVLDRRIRLLLTALRARKLGREDLSQEFMYEDQEDPLIQELLHGFPSDASDLRQLFELNAEDPGKLREAMIRYRFEKIEQERGLDDFSIDRLLAYMIQLYLVEISRKDNI